MAAAGLCLDRVTHAFNGLRVLDDVSLAVTPGEIVSLLGPSGCGKTTALRLAAGLERLQQGRIEIGGRVVARPGDEVPPEARGVGMVFQEYALFPHLSVLENVAFGLTARPAAERREISLGMLERVKMRRFADSYPHTLSGGEQQRVALARALAPRPAAMLLDEPFANLDVRLRDAVRDDALSLLRETGAVTLMVTHDPDEAMRMADRIAVMRLGRIEQVGAPDEVYRRPNGRFVAEFFGETSVLQGTVAADGRVETAAGALPARGLPRGCRVDVLARPEAARLGGAGALARVAAARELGPFALVELRLPDGHRLRVRVGPGAAPPVGSETTVSLDPELTFAFPSEPL